MDYNSNPRDLCRVKVIVLYYLTQCFILLLNCFNYIFFKCSLGSFQWKFRRRVQDIEKSRGDSEIICLILCISLNRRSYFYFIFLVVITVQLVFIYLVIITVIYIIKYLQVLTEK